MRPPAATISRLLPEMPVEAIAGVNALAFHFVTEYTVVQWDTAVRPPFAAKLAGGLSVLLWINVVIAGRLIPYAKTWLAEV